jgi:hypothetical protein
VHDLAKAGRVNGGVKNLFVQWKTRRKTTVPPVPHFVAKADVEEGGRQLQIFPAHRRIFTLHEKACDHKSSGYKKWMN